MEINNATKTMINKLQYRIVPCYESDNILLIFDNKTKLFLIEDDKKKFTSDYIDNHNVKR